MKFYHIDRIGTLASGMKIENTFTAPTGIDQTLFEKFFPNGLSHWGKSMFESFPDRLPLLMAKEFCDPFTPWPSITGAYFNTVYAEIMLELVRAAYFPALPSRFSSFFTAYGFNALKLWNEKLKRENTRVFEVESSKQPVFFDASLLPGKLYYGQETQYIALIGISIPSILLSTHSYWDSASSCAQESAYYHVSEALLTPPVVIGRQVPPEELDVFLQEPLSQR